VLISVLGAGYLGATHAACLAAYDPHPGPGPARARLAITVAAEVVGACADVELALVLGVWPEFADGAGSAA
jgi:hypothetical protein